MTPPPGTWGELAVRVFAEHGVTVDSGEADRVLWDFTSFPFGRPEEVEGQLHEAAERTAGQAP